MQKKCATGGMQKKHKSYICTSAETDQSVTTDNSILFFLYEMALTHMHYYEELKYTQILIIIIKKTTGSRKKYSESSPTVACAKRNADSFEVKMLRFSLPEELLVRFDGLQPCYCCLFACLL